MPIRGIPVKLKPDVIGEKIADAIDVEINASGFDGNLTTGATDVQELAQQVDDLTIGGMSASSQVTLSFASDNRAYFRSDSNSYEQIGLLHIRNDQIEITHMIANAYAQSNNVSAIFIALQDINTGLSLGVINDGSPATDTDHITPLQALSNVPSEATTDLNVRILVARAGGGMMDELRLSTLTIYYNFR